MWGVLEADTESDTKEDEVSAVEFSFLSSLCLEGRSYVCEWNVHKR